MFIENLRKNDFVDFADSCGINILYLEKSFKDESILLIGFHKSDKRKVSVILSDFDCIVDSLDFEERSKFLKNWMKTMRGIYKDHYVEELCKNKNSNFKVKGIILGSKNPALDVDNYIFH